MHRRSWLKSLAGWGIAAATAAVAAPPARAATDGETVLYIDFNVDPADEAPMLDVFHTKFKPAAEKRDGYIDLKMVKLRPLRDAAPGVPVTYRFQLTFENETKRRAWVASDEHKKYQPMVWAYIKNDRNQLSDVL